jgi:hypothetical protein
VWIAAGIYVVGEVCWRFAAFNGSWTRKTEGGEFGPFWFARMRKSWGKYLIAGVTLLGRWSTPATTRDKRDGIYRISTINLRKIGPFLPNSIGSYFYHAGLDFAESVFNY